MLAAVLGGYLLASCAALAAAARLPLPVNDAVVVGTMLSFACYAAVPVWCFAVRSALRAWTGVLGASALLALLALQSQRWLSP